eukprot:2665-Heterococcus_DN1.PRE.3
MEKAVWERSAHEPGAMRLAYRRDMDAGSNLAASVQQAVGLLAVLKEPNNASYVPFAIQRLSYFECTDSLCTVLSYAIDCVTCAAALNSQQYVMQFEYCLLLDRAGKVLVAPHNMSTAGETFDLGGVGTYTLLTSGLSLPRAAPVAAATFCRPVTLVHYHCSLTAAVSMRYCCCCCCLCTAILTAAAAHNTVANTLASGTGYMRTGLIAVDQLRRFNAPLWNDKLLASTATSKLHPYDTGAEALLRWYSINCTLLARCARIGFALLTEVLELALLRCAVLALSVSVLQLSNLQSAAVVLILSFALLHLCDLLCIDHTNRTSTPMYLPNNTAADRTPDGL